MMFKKNLIVLALCAVATSAYSKCSKADGQKATRENLSDLLPCIFKNGTENPNFLGALIKTELCENALNAYQEAVTFKPAQFKFEEVNTLPEGDKLATACCLYAKRATDKVIEGVTTREKTAEEKKADAEQVRTRMQKVEEYLKDRAELTLPMVLGALKVMGSGEDNTLRRTLGVKKEASY